MIRSCAECAATYDDCLSVTYCPHERFISDEDAQRKDAAFQLLGKDLHLAGQQDGPLIHVQSIDHRGMIRVTRHDGEFEPKQFVEAQP